MPSRPNGSLRKQSAMKGSSISALRAKRPRSCMAMRRDLRSAAAEWCEKAKGCHYDYCCRDNPPRSRCGLRHAGEEDIHVRVVDLYSINRSTGKCSVKWRSKPMHHHRGRPLSEGGIGEAVRSASSTARCRFILLQSEKCRKAASPMSCSIMKESLAARS